MRVKLAEQKTKIAI